jgi:hypothetical protein
MAPEIVAVVRFGLNLMREATDAMVRSAINAGLPWMEISAGWYFALITSIAT